MIMKRNIPENLLKEPCFENYTILNINKMKLLKSPQNSLILISLFLLIIITGCANNEIVEQCLSGHKYGFFGGLWHGFIAPFDFIGMLFNNEITMYAQNNNGGLYALGFLLGSGGWGFFGSKGVNRVQRRRVNIRPGRIDEAEIVE